ncbi:fimbrial protein [Pseudocitrobacter corydidari]
MSFLRCIFSVSVIFFFCCAARAEPTGYCVAIGGTHHNYLSFAGKHISYMQNNAGQSFSTQVNNGDSYEATCYCLTDGNSAWLHTYFTAKPNPALMETGNRNGVNYYYINEYLDVGLSINILGVGYVNVPFNYVANVPAQGSYPYCVNGVEPTTRFVSGSDATIYFYIKQPFIGVQTIPPTMLARLYATITANDPLYSEPVTDVYIGGDITAPQSCELNSGQVITFDFKSIAAAEFSSTVGTVLTGRKIKQTVSVQCTGMSSGQNVDVSLHATPVGSNTTMIKTSNTDVGIKVFDVFDNVVDVNGGRMATNTSEVSSGKTNGDLIFSAAPASATGVKPQPGKFDATATLTVEIKN